MTDELNNSVSFAAYENIVKWRTQNKYSEYKDDVELLIQQKQWQVLEDCFFKEIEFGTGGRRGKTGVGSNRINKVTIGESTQALCLYAASTDVDAAKKGVVIACDTRLSSKELSEYTASVCAANGFKTYLFDSFRSTPELSFAVRHFKTAIGIVISASHNPPEDNGFKAYWSDGAQLVSPHDTKVIETATSITKIHSMSFDTAVANNLIEIIGEAVDTSYLDAVAAQSEGSARDLSIVYSPLHGAGQTNVLPALKKVGFKDIFLVDSQMTPDGNFPTVKNFKPNPEEQVANEQAVSLMMEQKADIAITNDPDADRIGVMVRQGNMPIFLSGNQSAVLAANYSLKKLKEKNELSSKHYVAKTIVTTDMLSALASHYGVTTYSNMLIGFKYIGRLLREKESTDEVFVIGAEESYGLLKGTYARDKDGATGALPIAEYAAELKLEGKTLYDELLQLYRVHGLYTESLDSAYFEGASGFHKMEHMMESVRTEAPKEVGGHPVTSVIDYSTLTETNTITGDKQTVDCDKGNVIVLVLDGEYRRRITIRPSGTEPKIKMYIQWYEEAKNNIQEQLVTIDQEIKTLSIVLKKRFLE